MLMFNQIKNTILKKFLSKPKKGGRENGAHNNKWNSQT